MHSHIHGPQDYFISGKLSNIQSSHLNQLRCKGVNEFRSNFQSTIHHFECSIGTLSAYTQEHALQCHGVRKHLQIDQRIIADSITYEDLVGQSDRKVKITEAFQIIFKTSPDSASLQPSWATYRAMWLVNYTFPLEI